MAGRAERYTFNRLMEDKAIRGVPWTLLSLGANRAVTLLSTLVLARLLAPADFGLMAIVLTAVNFLYWFAGLGFGNALVVRQDLDRRGQGTVLTLMVASSTAGALIALACAPLAAALFEQPRLTGLLSAMAIAVWLSGIGGFYDSSLQRELEFRRRFVAMASQTLVYAITSVALAAAGLSVWSLVIGQLAGGAVYAAAVLLLVRHPVGPHWDRGVARSVIRSGCAFLGQGVSNFVRQNADTVVLARAFGARPLGYYTMAYRLGDMTYWAIADPVARVTFPGFARSRHRGEDVRPAFLGVLRLVALVGCPTGLLLSACAMPLVEVVFGAAWRPMAGPLAVLGVWAAVRPLESTLSWLLNAMDRAGSAGWVSVIILVPLIPGLVVAASLGNLTTVAAVPLADALLAVVLLAVMVRREIAISAGDLWRALRPVLLASPPMWCAGRLVSGLVDGPAALRLVVAAAAALAAYGAALTLVEPGILRRTAEQMLRALGRGRQVQPVPAP
jgi:PST family polysaccharide transporter